MDQIPILSCRKTTSGYEIHSGVDEAGNSYCIAQGLTEVQALCMVAGPILLRWVALFRERSPLGPDLKVLWRRLNIAPIYSEEPRGVDTQQMAMRARDNAEN